MCGSDKDLAEQEERIFQRMEKAENYKKRKVQEMEELSKLYLFVDLLVHAE